MKGLKFSRRNLLQLGAMAAITAAVSESSEQPLAKPFSFQKANSGPLSEKKFSTKGLFMHAWDLRDQGADRVMGWMSDSGLNEMYIAGTYHSGWFIHPHSPDHRTYMTEGSVAYFQPDHKLYKTPMRPQV